MADGVADGVADELVDAVSASEPHAASVMTNDAAQVTSVTEEGRRSEFTAVRIQPHWIPTDGRPSVMFGCRPRVQTLVATIRIVSFNRSESGSATGSHSRSARDRPYGRIPGLWRFLATMYTTTPATTMAGANAGTRSRSGDRRVCRTVGRWS